MSIGKTGAIYYHVLNGQSTTWGSFGGSTLKVSLGQSVNSLGGYSPATSVKNSGASWESNLVIQLTLVQVRYYAAGQLISTDTTPRNLISPAPAQ
jgi:hypothetical protein